MTKSSKRKLVCAVAALFVLLAPSAAFAGGKGGGGGKQAAGDRPKESVSLNYTSQQFSYSKKGATSGQHIPEATNTHRKAGRGQQ